MAEVVTSSEVRTGTKLGIAVFLAGVGGSLFWLVVTLVGYSNPGGLTLGAFLAIFGLGVVLIVIALTAAVALAFGPMRGLQWIAWLGIACVPLALLAAVLIVKARLPLELRVARSEEALLRYEDQVRSGAIPPGQREKVGWFTVIETRFVGECAVFVTVDELLNKDGLAHCPDGLEPPRTSGAGDFKRIRKNWWEATDIGY